ncbi:MAG: GGDEF domain-containing protein [bacterium]|nr:GGDEF domain-containing protein [bacterium]
MNDDVEKASGSSREELVAELDRLRQENRELREENKEFKKRLTFDRLTGFYREEVAQSKALVILKDRFINSPDPFLLSMLVIDFDGLKWLNDHYSHETGDAAIRRFGEFVREDIIPILNKRYSLPGIEEPFFAFRFFSRGDEFGLVLFGVDKKGAETVAKELQEIPLAFEFQPQNGDSRTEIISYSVGTASIEEEGVEAIKAREGTSDAKAREIYDLLKSRAEEKERANKKERKGNG